MVRLQPELLEQALEHGLIYFRVSKLARKAGVSESTVRLWTRGAKVSDDSAQAITEALAAAGEVSR